jgi:hypothetical protein
MSEDRMKKMEGRYKVQRKENHRAVREERGLGVKSVPLRHDGFIFDIFPRN